MLETERLLQAAAAPAAVDSRGRRQRDDAGAGTLRPLPRRRRGRAPIAGSSSANAAAVAPASASALSSRPRSWRRRRAESWRSSDGRSVDAGAANLEPLKTDPRCRNGTYVYLRHRGERGVRACRRRRAAVAGHGPVRLLDVEPWSVPGWSPTRRSAGTAKRDQRRLSDLDWVSRAAVAHEAVDRIVHRRDRRPADEAVHDLHERRARAGAHRPAADADRVARQARREPSGVGRSRRARSRGSGARVGASIARSARPRLRARPAPPTSHARRRSAMRRSSWPRARANGGRAVRSARGAIEAGEAPSGERAASAGRTAAARRGVSRAAGARGRRSGRWRRARRGRWRGRATAMTVSGPWPPYTFVQD